MANSKKDEITFSFERDQAHDRALIAELRAKRKAPAKKSADSNTPAPLPDPHGVAFTDEELDALTDTTGEASVALAFGTATDDAKKMLGAKEGG